MSEITKKAILNHSRQIMTLGDSCCGCGACAAKCPRQCIAMERDEAGFLRPEISEEGCIGCAACDKVCPVLSCGGHDQADSVLWAQSKETDLLSRSSSGGIFGLLATIVINQGGIVVGAAWDDQCRILRHVCVNQLKQLDSIMRSKYVQSVVSVDVYKDVQRALDLQRLVLFTGTACQIAALKSYLGDKSKSSLLLLVDVICHGVPSPKLWQKWLHHRVELQGSIVDVNFRSKSTGWTSYSVVYHRDVATSEDVSDLSNLFFNDWYMQAFLQNASLRPSCFSCCFKRACGSDLTLGDYWGIQTEKLSIDSSQGVSAVIINTKRGAAASRKLLPFMNYGDGSFEEVAAGNPALVRSVEPYPDYRAFQNAIATDMPISEMIRNWSFKKSLLGRVKNVLSLLLSKAF